jgi:hypothetical protein
MAKQSFSTGQVLTAAQMTSLQQTAMGGGSPSVKTSSYVLVAADAGTVIQMNSSSATTITVNTSLFAAGDSVQIQNIGAGTTTITAGTATVNSAGTLGVTQYDGGFLYFSSTSSAIWFDYTQTGTSLPLTTKGDLFGFSTTNARIPIGTDNQILTADSTQALGLKWASPASSGGMTLITETVASAATSISFSSIPQTYKQLILVWGAMNHSGSTGNFSLRLNNSSSSVYAMKAIETSGSSVNQQNELQTSFRTTNTVSFGNNVQGDGVYETAVNGYVIIDNYASTSKYKQIWGYYAYTDATSAKRGSNALCSFLDTTAITSLDIVRLSGSATISNFTNTSIRLYGLS